MGLETVRTVKLNIFANGRAVIVVDQRVVSLTNDNSESLSDSELTIRLSTPVSISELALKHLRKHKDEIVVLQTIANVDMAVGWSADGVVKYCPRPD
jgi:short-subunit dehydrogenase involved in D-alanine esterification of teichoic acids